MNCDVTKVTYNMYSYYTCCMSREMMEMDGRGNAKCKKSKSRDIDGIIEFVLNDNKKKFCIVSSPPIEIRSQKREWKREREVVAYFYFFSERECSFSLGLRAIRP